MRKAGRQINCVDSSEHNSDRSAFAGKTALVTGASRGIGLAIAEELAREGCTVVITARDPRQLKAAAAGISKRNRQDAAVVAETCDVTDEKAVERLFAQIKKRFGHLDILVNNAGRVHAMMAIEDLTPDVWREVIDTNLTGTFLCTRSALPLMAAGGAIVNNLSVAATVVFPRQSAYIAAKHGALGFTNALREEVRGRGIRVLALMPGATNTGVWSEFWPEAPRERMMDPATVARALVRALALPETASVEELKIGPTAGAL